MKMYGTDPEVKVYACNAGSLKTETQYILKDTRIGTPMEIPVPFLVIRHGQEWIAFDTGCNGATANDPAAYWGEELAKHFWPVMDPTRNSRERLQHWDSSRPTSKPLSSATATSTMPARLRTCGRPGCPSMCRRWNWQKSERSSRPSGWARLTARAISNIWGS